VGHGQATEFFGHGNADALSCLSAHARKLRGMGGQLVAKQKPLAS